MHDGAAGSDFERADQQANQKLRLRHAKVGCVLVMLLMPAGSLLDAIVYPDMLVPFLWVRWATNAAVAVTFVLLFTPLGHRHLAWLGNLWVFAPAVGIAWMVYATEGEASPYYAGLNMIILGACLLMPFTLVEATAIGVSVLGVYLVGCIANEGAIAQWRDFGNNLYFIVLTIIIGVTLCHFHRLRRVEDFRLRYALDQRNRQLAELDRLKTDFVANISHELRTPLTLILAPVDRLLQNAGDFTADTQRVLQTIRHNGLRLLRLIDDLLDAVRLDASRPADRGKWRPIDLARYVRGLTDSVRGLAQSKQIAVVSEGVESGLVVVGDAASLEKAFLNLLTNAVKFTPEQGSITVRIADRDGRAEVTIADTGIGIPSEHLPSIFDRFRQVDSSSTRRHQGMGLGLALVKEWIERHGGHIEVASTPGKGTAFTVTLPTTATPDDETVLSSSDQAEATFVPPQPPGPTRALAAAPAEDEPHATPIPTDHDSQPCVLIVDDEPDMRTFLVEMLTDDYRVVVAEDGKQALRLASDRQPDAMVLDLMLPEMDGLEVCRRLRATDGLADLGVLVLTARGDERSKIEALQAGANDFLTKPFSTVEMRTRLDNLLTTRRLQTELRSRNQELEDTISTLRATRSQLIHSEKMNALGALAAGLLHEINNPLNYTLTALQLAQQDAGTLEEPVRETLDDIGEGMGRIRDIVSDLRAFVHPGGLSSRSSFPLREAVESALRLTTHLQDHDIVEHDVPADLCVLASKSHVTQVLVNLISNGIRAVQQVKEDRTPRVTIRAASERDAAIIRVVDNGVGIPEHKMRRVFDPFYTTRDVGEGMGLGLSICHTIVLEHQGSIHLQSDEGVGTTVTVQLPI